jgi:hypothetical protein
VSGFRYSVGVSLSDVPDGGHQATPVKDSWYSEKTLQVANLKAEGAYPVIAVCQRCSGRIRLAHYRQMEWRHVPADPEAPEPKPAEPVEGA